MKNSISVKVNKCGNRITYEYEVTGEWCEAFNIDEIQGWFATAGCGVRDFFIEYDENIESVPDSIAVIPFLCNVLPISWVYDAEIIASEVDEDFYNSITGFKRGYIGMYPDADLRGSLTPGRLITNRLSPVSQGSLLFFSGGVDANFTLLSTLEKRPLLVTLWGADIYFSNIKEWEVVSDQNRAVARTLGLQYAPVKSSFRFFINYRVLDEKFARPNQASSWWHGFQHGIGLIGHSAPLAWKRSLREIYIASSYSIKDDQNTKCASWPTIDQFLRFSDCMVSHHDFRYTRQAKLREICNMSECLNVPVTLRVCWQPGHATNCGKCEKCLRTMFGVLAESRDPQRFGFSTEPKLLVEIAELLKAKKVRPTKFWTEIVEKLSETPLSTESHVRALIESHYEAKELGKLI
ncbi:hypothetical protein ACFSQU_17235 [Massilia sp. GCM10020059]|uniref:7-cyano-7-deazaguanine synthase n=1 Tax=Massilia agrisoli TaxID=2892444 RepID=A0ABS8IRK3_9BURK|nr:hypothetical protein [Massilia agrisoli]MCC6071282.1 hypothetical protein [Massilia agrisoli]